MYKLIYWDGERPAGTVYDRNLDTLCEIAACMKQCFWKVCVWTIGTTYMCPAPGFEKECEEYKRVFDI